MKQQYLAALLLSFCGPVTALAATEACSVPFVDEVQKNKLYVHVEADGTWKPVEGIREYERSETNQYFAYGIRDGRKNSGGMALFKIVDIAKGDEIKNRNVQLSRNGSQKLSWKKLRNVSEMRGNIDIQVYQDIHSNTGRDIDRTLRKFHTRYQYDGNGNRDTFDAKRRNVFAFDQIKGIESPRSFLDIFRGPAWAGVRSGEGIVALRSTLKYYSDIPAKDGAVICFTAKIHEDALRTQVTVVDLDSPGPYADHEEVLQGRNRTWTLRWKRTDKQEE